MNRFLTISLFLFGLINQNFAQDFCWAKQGNRWGLLGTNNQWLIKPNKINKQRFDDGWLIVSDGKHWGMQDLNQPFDTTFWNGESLDIFYLTHRKFNYYTLPHRYLFDITSKAWDAVKFLKKASYVSLFETQFLFVLIYLYYISV